MLFRTKRNPNNESTAHEHYGYKAIRVLAIYPSHVRPSADPAVSVEPWPVQNVALCLYDGDATPTETSWDDLMEDIDNGWQVIQPE